MRFDGISAKRTISKINKDIMFNKVVHISQINSCVTLHC